MQSAVAESLFHRLIESFPPRRVYVPSAFEREPMPAPVAHFLKHWLRHRLRHEASRLELPRSEWFNYEVEGVQRARRNLADALIEHGHFPAATWEASLREAVQQVTAYLVCPATTLTGFVFQKENRSVPVHVLDWRLGYFKEYSYFHEAAQAYVEEHREQEVEQDRFAGLLRAIEQKITRDYDAEAWLTLLAPLFDLTRRAGVGQGVPMAVLIAFFKDKDAPAILDRLARHQQSRNVEALDEDSLRRVLTGADEPTLAVAPPEAAPPPQSEGPVPRWKQFQQQQPTPSSPPARKPKPSRGFSRTPDDPAPSSNQEARPRWMQYRPDAEPAPAGEPPATPLDPSASAVEPPARSAPADLVTLEQTVLGEAGADKRDLFVNSLFDRSIDAYERVLRQLYATPHWNEASKIIADDVFRAFQINIYSDPAILFTDAVEARYLERKT